jgi:GNAT superfamily N-acetyltransferase
MNLRIALLDKERRDDFYRIHHEGCEMSGCYCTAWWVPTWEELENRTPQQNHALRENLFRDAIYDGYLLYADEQPVGWCQCGPRDRMPKVAQTYNLIPHEQAWAITCIYLVPNYREIGLAHFFMDEIINDLTRRGIKYVQGFPRRGVNLTSGDVWTGPEAIFQEADFKLERDDPLHPVYSRKLIAQEG